MKKGIVLSNAVPSAEKEEAVFAAALDRLAGHDMQVVEFYADTPARAARYADMLRARSLEPIFLSAIDQKRSGFCRLCAEDEAVRLRSLDFTKRTVEKAIGAGAARTLIQGGAFPADPADEPRCLDALLHSFRALSEFAGSSIHLAVEPCDRSLEARHLLGPTLETCTFMDNLNRANFSLTMDVSHCLEQFEDPYVALELAKPHCSHIHIANCVLDRTAPLFGDKHPLLDVEKGALTTVAARALCAHIARLYEGQTLTISLEMICRESDALAYLDRVLAQSDHLYAENN